MFLRVTAELAQRSRSGLDERAIAHDHAREIGQRDEAFVRSDAVGGPMHDQRSLAECERPRDRRQVCGVAPLTPTSIHSPRSTDPSVRCVPSGCVASRMMARDGCLSQGLAFAREPLPRDRSPR